MNYYNNQITTAEEILSKFYNDSRYQILLAEMQSGKSGTYLYLSCSMIEKMMIEHVYIITGNWAVKLRCQCLKDVKDGVITYIDKNANILTNDIKKKLRENIHVIWGQELDKTSSIPPKSLIIWDESHYAQKSMNKPYQFFIKNGIQKSLVGDIRCLEEKNIYLLSVSATPFSELAGNIRTTRNEWSELPLDIDLQLTEKMVTVMITPLEYFGVNYYFKNNCVHPSFSLDDDNLDSLKTLFEKYINRKGYFIIRSIGDSDLYEHPSILNIVCNELDIPIEYDYGSHSSSIFQEETYPYEGLKKTPSKFTVIHIKGKMRMGQVVPKKNIIGVFETSRNPNIDVVLQSLFGRMCGYSSILDPFIPNNIDIYIPSASIPLVYEYGSLMKERKVDELICKINRASCVVGRDKPPSTHTHGWYPIIPVYIPSNLFIKKGIKSKDINSTVPMLTKLKEIIDENKLLQYQNTIQENEINSNFIKSGVGDGRNLILKSYVDFKLPYIFMKGYKDKKNIKSNQDNFIRDYTPAKPRQLSFFYVCEKENVKLSEEMKLMGLNNGDAFLIGYTKNQTEELKKKHDEPCPVIHEDCDFHPLSALLKLDQIPENHNGCQVIFAPANTYNHVRSFRKWLKECINRNKTGSWTALIDPDTNSVKYILLKRDNFMVKKNDKYQLTNVVDDISKKTKTQINICFADNIFSNDKRHIQLKQITWKLC